MSSKLFSPLFVGIAVFVVVLTAVGYSVVQQYFWIPSPAADQIVESDVKTNTLYAPSSRRDWADILQGTIKPREPYTISVQTLGGRPLEFDSRYVIHWYLSDALKYGNEMEILLYSSNGEAIGTLNSGAVASEEEFLWDVKTYYPFRGGGPSALESGEVYSYQLLLFAKNGEFIRRNSGRDFTVLEFEQAVKNPFGRSEVYVLERQFPTGTAGTSTPWRRDTFTYFNPRDASEVKFLVKEEEVSDASLFNGNLLFINSQSELEVYRLEDASSSIFQTDTPVFDYLISDGEIYYLSDCTFEKTPKGCARLYRYTVDSRGNSIILENIYDHISPVFYGGFYLKRLDRASRTLEIASVGGDAGAVWGTLWGFNMDTKRFTVIEESGTTYCVSEGCEGLRENKAFEALFDKEIVRHCKEYNKALVPEDALFIGCYTGQ